MYLVKIGLKLQALYVKTYVSCRWQRRVQSNTTETVLLCFRNKICNIYFIVDSDNVIAIYSECTVAFPWQQHLG